MKIVNLKREQAKKITGFDSVDACSVTSASGSGEAHIHTLYFEPGGEIGRHPAGPCQLLLAVHGSGWVEGDDGVRHAIECGEAAYIQAGEVHAKGSETGMTAIMVQVAQLALQEDA